MNYRMGIKLKTKKADMEILKILRKYFPEQPLSALKSRVQSGDYIYLNDNEKYLIDGERLLLQLLREFQHAHIQTVLFEEFKRADGWEARPMPKQILYNSIRSSRIIAQQVEEDIENEADE